MRDHALELAALQRVQQRREWPVRVVQRLQITLQNRLITPSLGSDARCACRGYCA